ncbi:CPSF A subunit region-domain-containing protein [Paraphysoderma sedebokerense]|nr:CPSF A subunit region-domain-containing protein [Paraphysoderma sedebokerense]
MSLLEFNTATQTPTTVSIHFYERDEYKEESLYFGGPNLIVDPSNRCAALHFYHDHLAILPFREKDVILENDELDQSSKWPYHPSFVMKAQKLDPNIQNIKSVVFLENYYEPTIAILYEPVKTWIGRIATRKDTCRIAVISLDLHQNVYPLLFSVSSLPTSSHTLIAVPAPLGGVLLATVNGLIYVDQSHPNGVGATINAYAPAESSYSYSQDLSHLSISLEAAKHSFLSPDRVLLSLKNGDIWICQLLRDGGRSVEKFHFEHVGRTSIATCLKSLPNDYLFVGSRLGDSVLMKVENAQGQTVNRAIEPPAKRVKMASQNEDTDLYGDSIMSPTKESFPSNVQSPKSGQTESILLYDVNTYTSTSGYTFTVVDKLLSISPVTDSSVGISAEQDDNQDESKEYQMVLCSGYGDTGALTVLETCIHPRIENSFELADAKKVWSIRTKSQVMFDGPASGSSKRKRKSAVGRRGSTKHNFDSYLIVTTEKNTMIFTTGEEMRQIDDVDFVYSEPTIEAGTIQHDSKIVQVVPTSVRVLDTDGTLLQEVPIGSGNEEVSIVSAHIMELYILLLMSDGDASLLTVDETTKDLTIMQSGFAKDTQLRTGCIFSETSHVFKNQKEYRDLEAKIQQRSPKPKRRDRAGLNGASVQKPSSAFAEGMELDDLDDVDLYGNAADNEVAVETPDDDDPNDVDVEHITEENVSKTAERHLRYYLVLAWEDGSLEISSLPDLQPVFFTSYFGIFPQVLYDSMSASKTRKTAANPKQNETEKKSTPNAQCEELAIVTLGEASCETYLLVRLSNGELIIYRAFHFVSPEATTNSSRRLATRFLRLQLGLSTLTSSSECSHELRINHFRNICGKTGVFVAGTQPLWIFGDVWGQIFCHTQSANNGRVVSFTPFHNVNCTRGFLFLTEKGKMCMSTIPDGMSYDFYFPIRKYSLQKTPHCISYHSEKQMYVAATSTKSQYTLVVEASDLQEHHPPPGVNAADVETDVEAVAAAAVENRSSGQYLPIVERFKLELVTPATFETIDEHEFEENEHVLCVKIVSMESKETASGRKPFLVVGTGFMKGEDVTTRGKIYMFEIITVVPEPGKPLFNHKFKLVGFEEVKGAVTCIAGIGGHLLAGLGQKIIMYDFEDNERLQGIAFQDMNLMVNSIATARNFILAGDLYKSASFLAFQEDPPKLQLLGKDYYPLHVTSVDYIIDGPNVSFVLGDEDGNIHLLAYAPYNVQSVSGNKLLRKGDFHIGPNVTTFLRMHMNEANPIKLDAAVGNTESTPAKLQHLCYYGTTDGSLNLIMPVTEKIYKRLILLYNKMVPGIQHHAGLNPKSFRVPQNSLRLYNNPQKTILDGDLIYQFLDLSSVNQKELTQQVGTTVEKVVTDLRGLEMLAKTI